MCRLGDTDRTSGMSKKGRTDILRPKGDSSCESRIKGPVVARFLSSSPSSLSPLIRHARPYRHPLPRRRQAAREVHARQTCHRGMPSPNHRLLDHHSRIFISTTPSFSPLCSGTRSLPPMRHNSPSPPPATTPHAPLPARTIGYSSSSALVLYIPPSRPSSMPNSSEPKFPLGKTW